jgi:two-component system, chemotaxis family, CheB/CheR fusion protein
MNAEHPEAPGNQTNSDSGLPAAGSPGTSSSFPVVGIGASAGGLEALEQFLEHVPRESGMAFVIVQHLDPDRKGMLPDLLQRVTGMRVVQAKNRMPVKVNCVYVIPPNKDMSISQGMLCLHTPTTPRGLRLPIDFFLRSLAQERGAQSVGVILSGMGSDGTKGLRAIKQHGGLGVAQEASSAKFDSMPHAVAAAGLADLIAPPYELPQKIATRLQSPSIARTVKIDRPEKKSLPDDILNNILAQLCARTGRDFSVYKKSGVCRRIERRMSVHKLDQMSAYARYVSDNPQELDLLFKELLIGVTSFFRDATVWNYLTAQTLPALLAAYPGGKAMRAWVPGCSTGEEAYSLAIAFKDAVERARPAGQFTLHIFATDLDKDAIGRARQGQYPVSIADDVAPELLKRFFIKDESGYRICKEIREMVTFAPQDIVRDSPFTKLDFLFCRNLLIYFTADLHKKLIPLFHYSLNPGGVLLLGSAETTGNFTNLFTPLESNLRIYRRVDLPMRTPMIEFPTGAGPVLSNTPGKGLLPIATASIQSLADQLLLQRFSPAAALVNEHGDILYINGRTGKYLEPAAGKANWNIFAMAREGLRGALTRAMHKAMHEKGKVTMRQVMVRSDSDSQAIDLTVQAIEDPAALRGMLIIVFAEAPVVRTTGDVAIAQAGVIDHAGVAELEQALVQAREENRILHEEMQATQDELKSANEELQSNNEELQSTNEELNSSREEMQSMNEELQTINAELQSKVDDLSRTSSDMKNLLDSTDIATVFLDNAFCIRRFTTRATQIFKLIPGDVGRPLSDIVTELFYAELHNDVQEVLRTLAFREKQIAARDGRWFKIRVMPYRTVDNVIDGVVITFSDITAAKALEAELRAQCGPSPIGRESTL